jgi:hypothetical protein
MVELKTRLRETIRQLVAELHASIAHAIERYPEKTYRQIAADFMCSEGTVLKAASKYGLSRLPGPKPRCTDSIEGGK